MHRSRVHALLAAGVTLLALLAPASAKDKPPAPAYDHTGRVVHYGRVFPPGPGARPHSRWFHRAPRAEAGNRTSGATSPAVHAERSP